MLGKDQPLKNIFATSSNVKEKPRKGLLDVNGNDKFPGITPITSPGKKRGRRSRLYYLCRNCTDVFRTRIGQISHVKACSKLLYVFKKLPIENCDQIVPDVVKAEEKLEVKDNKIEEKLETDAEESRAPDGTTTVIYPSLNGQTRPLTKINVHEDIELTDQVDVDMLLTPQAVVHSPDYLFKRKSPESPKSEDKKSEHLAEASTSDSPPVIFDQDINQIKTDKSFAENITCICKSCSAAPFETELELMRHVRASHSYSKTKMILSEVKKFYDVKDKTKCPICFKPINMKFRSAFRNHLQTHSSEKLHVCKICDKKFNRVEYLRRHVRLHVTIKAESPEQLGAYEKINDYSDEETDAFEQVKVESTGSDCGRTAVEPRKVDVRRSEETKVNDAVVQRVCYGPAQDGSDHWVIKWQRTEYKNSTPSKKCSVVTTQTLDEVEIFEEPVCETPNVEPDPPNSTKTGDSSITTPVCETPSLKELKGVLDSNTFVEQRNELEVEHELNKHLKKRKLLATRSETDTVKAENDFSPRPTPMSGKADQEKSARSYVPAFKKGNARSLTKLEMNARHFKKRRILAEYVDQLEEADPRNEQSLSKLAQKPPAGECIKTEQESKRWHGVDLRVVIDSTIVDQFDQAFERSAEGLIQQLKQVSLKRSRKESSIALESSGCPKVVGKSGAEKVRLK